MSKTSKDKLDLGGKEGQHSSQTPLLEQGHRKQAGRNGSEKWAEQLGLHRSEARGEGPAGMTLDRWFRVK